MYERIKQRRRISERYHENKRRRKRMRGGRGVNAQRKTRNAT